MKQSEKIKLALQLRGDKLRRWRIMNGFSLAELGRLTGKHPTTVFGWENGAVIPRSALVKLVDAGWKADEAIVNIGVLPRGK